MKSFITPTYTFTPGTSGVGTLNLSGIDNFDIKRLVAVINLRTNTIIYNVVDSTLGYNSVSSTLITLDADTSSMLTTDPLQIIYDNDDAITNNELIQAIEALRMSIQSLTRSGLGQSYPDTSGRLRVLLDAITASLTLATVTTVSTVSNQTNVGGFSGTEQIPSLMRMSADSLRRNISVS
jgi:hypothetical protein